MVLQKKRHLYGVGLYSDVLVSFPQDSGDQRVYDYREMAPSSQTFFLDFEGMKEVLDKAVITKDYSETVR